MKNLLSHLTKSDEGENKYFRIENGTMAYYQVTTKSDGKVKVRKIDGICTVYTSECLNLENQINYGM